LFDAMPICDGEVQLHPLRSDRTSLTVRYGATVSEIVASAELDPRFGQPVVVLQRGGSAWPIPLDRWGQIRPKPGTKILISYEVAGPAIGAILSSLVTAAAPTIAGSLFPTLTGLGLKLATAAITVIGGLLVNALIPPPSQPGAGQQDPAQLAITGIQNAEDRYGIVPKVLGRRRIFPKKMSRGYTETVDGDIYFRGRFTFGYGPVTLSEIRIGNTPIEQFEGVELEFLNVDEDRTFANQPGIGGLTRAWRQGTELMTLCPDDVVEDGYNVLLEDQVPVVRGTGTRAESAAIDITFPQGLFSQSLSDPGQRETRSHTFEFQYRELGTTTWINGGTKDVTSKQNSQFRITHLIKFPIPGEYEVSVKQASGNNPDAHHSDKGYLSAIRTFRAGQIPSHENVAELAIRVKATDELNGQIDTLNAVVHQMAPVWNGSSWGAAEPVRHPAWIYADALRGPQLRRPVPDARLKLDEIKAWADQEPHWTCDFVIESEIRTAEVLDIICAAGRARRALTDLKYSVIRESAASPIRQIYTPRNSWGFSGQIAFPRTVHALRCIVASERLDWADDEVIVYADGFDHTNATEFETLRLPGVVVTSDDNDQGNVWKLGRYHIAVSQLRPEVFEWYSDWEHLKVTRGDKVKLITDVAVAGVGAARINAIGASGAALQTIVIDDQFPGLSGGYRVTVRFEDGERAEITMLAPTDPQTREWTFVSGTVDATDLNIGDLITIEETAAESLEVIVTGIYPETDEVALLTGVPAAPDVMTADSGTIPAYAPVITPPRNEAVLGPAKPAIASVVSDATTASVDPAGAVKPRIAVYLETLSSLIEQGAAVQMRWRASDEQNWVSGPFEAIAQRSLMSGLLEQGRTYDVEIRSVGAAGRTRGWVPAGTIAANAPLALPQVPVWAAADTSSGSDILNVVAGKQVTVRWENPLFTAAGVAVFRPKETEVWRSGDATLTLIDDEPTNAQKLGVSVTSGFIDTTADFLTPYYYFLRAVDHNGAKSGFDAGRLVTTGSAAQVQMVNVFSDAQLFGYDGAGANPAPSNTVITAQANGFTSPFFEFLVDGASVQNSAVATLTYTPDASDANMPQVVRVDVREGAGTGSVLATDRLTIDAYRSAASAVNVVLSNEAHDVPASASGGSPDLSGAATSVLVTIGGVADTVNWSLAKNDGPGVTSALSGTTVTVTAMTNDTGYVDITASRAGYADITKRFSLSKAKAGASGADGIDGANGTDGTDGADGVSAVEVVIAGAARTVPANAAGVVSNYAESGCEINVYENTDTLGFIASTSSAALTPGTWQIYSTTVSPSGDITVGPISDGGNEAIIGNHSGMDSATDTVTITYRVRAKRDNGAIVTRSIRQTISKARAGQDGAAGNPGTDGASVLVIYGSTANEASNAQNLDPAGKNYVAYYEYTGATPSLPIRAGISFVKYIGEDGAPSQGVWPIYADDAGGSGQSFSDAGKTHVTFYEATSQPSLPVSGQTFVKHIGDDGTDGSDGTNGQDGADGARGPGEYFIAVGSMSAANSSAEAHSLFTSAVGAPVVDDTATFYTGTAANPTDQITWRYTGASWTEIVKRFKGSVVIDGTLYVQALVLDGSKFEGGPGDELTTKQKAFGEMQIKQDLTGTSIFADGSWQNIESFTLQNDAEGDMFIELTCVVYATGTDGSDVTTNYLDYQMRLVVDPPGAGSVIAVRSQRRLLPNGDAEVTISLPQADLSSRTAGTIDVDLDAKINGRNPAGFNLGVRDITLKAMELKT
jgi:hypothetical protein